MTFLVAFLAGAASVLGFSPFDLFIVALSALAVLVHLWQRSGRSAFLIGFFFGLGQFLAGVSWVYVSMHRFGAMPAPLAAIATLGFCAFLALFPAAVGWAQAKLPRAGLRAFAIPPLWVLLEWLRGWILTGFPWLTVGTAAIDSPLAGFAPLGGAYLVSLAALASAGSLWMVAVRWSRLPAAVAFAAIGIAGAVLGTLDWTVPARKPVGVALVQGNIAQSVKFDPARYERTLETYARLAEGSRARLTVLPETAVPRFLDLVDREWLARLDAAARRNNGDLLLGVPMRTGDRYFNSVIVLGASAPKVYDKVHLVPFGEFVPPGFGWITRLLQIPLSDFSRGLPDQQPLDVAGERVAVNICYEDAYGAEIARMLPAATLLVNVSNVAWFGDSLAPAQHLQIARMRALETGRMHLTATNTGITAAIGADGAVIAQLPQFSEGRLEVEARGRSGATPYVRLGDWGVLLVCALWLAGVALLGRSR